MRRFVRSRWAGARRIGDDLESVPAAGLLSLGVGTFGGYSNSYPYSVVGARLGGRYHAAESLSVIVDSSVTALWGDPRAPFSYEGYVSGGLGLRFKSIAFHAGVGWVKSWGGGTFSPLAPEDFRPETRALRFGSVQSLGFRRLPLVELFLSQSASLDLFADMNWDLRESAGRPEFMGGMTFFF